MSEKSKVVQVEQSRVMFTDFVKETWQVKVLLMCALSYFKFCSFYGNSGESETWLWYQTVLVEHQDCVNNQKM